MCEQPMRNRGNLRTSMTKREACKEYRNKSEPADCSKCFMFACDHNRYKHGDSHG